jgi:2-iminobutanoate/2-iminopropanoate deaminase
MSEAVVAPGKDARSFGNTMEQAYGFSQAVRIGDTIYVSGQTAMGDDFTVVGSGDMAAQMREAYAGVARVLAMYGADMGNVVDEVLFVTDTMAAATCAKTVRGEVYGDSFEVASTLIGIAALGSPDLMIEIKCVAHV